MNFTIEYGDDASMTCEELGEDVSPSSAVDNERPICMLITGLL